MTRLLFIELEERLSRVHAILTEIPTDELPASTSELMEEAEQLVSEARDILYQGDGFYASAQEVFRA